MLASWLSAGGGAAAAVGVSAALAWPSAASEGDTVRSASRDGALTRVAVGCVRSKLERESIMFGLCERRDAMANGNGNEREWRESGREKVCMGGGGEL